ncbi:hypothetical protein CICLE_v10031732mg [Citrus x clementina]|uniref:SET domain-containing protein n=1 Tax=Citrus clementina TaxID=85681 RepID=V4VEF0_CITCL|nr:hypothetical protein CICLE_v10031732mg [Citrus x clementina]
MRRRQMRKKLLTWLVKHLSLINSSKYKTISILRSKDSACLWMKFFFFLRKMCRLSHLQRQMLLLAGVVSALPLARLPDLLTLLRLKDAIGYTLDLKPSQIPHEEAGQGLFLCGEANVGAVIAIYPGIIYSPAYYRYIPGYPRVDAQNPYLITRYDGTVINAQPWGSGWDTRELWDGLTLPEIMPNSKGAEKGSDQFWKLLSKPMDNKRGGSGSEMLERRNPLALAHFANHPAKGMVPNVMICPYDFPLTEKDMRPYIPNISFGNAEEVNMRRFGSFWFKWGSGSGSSTPVLKTLALVATRAICDEEVLLNYRLSNSKRRPVWYSPVDEEEDRRRWS